MRSFPIVYSENVARSTAFWKRLGFEPWYSFPPTGEPGYVSLCRDGHLLAVTAVEWITQQYGMQIGAGPRFEMFVYVEDVDSTVTEFRGSGVTVLREPADMPWGERTATVQDPDGNPVSLANAASPGD